MSKTNNIYSYYYKPIVESIQLKNKVVEIYSFICKKNGLFPDFLFYKSTKNCNFMLA